MVEQVPTHAGQIGDRGDAQGAQFAGRADAGAQQQGGRVVGAGGQYDAAGADESATRRIRGDHFDASDGAVTRSNSIRRTVVLPAMRRWACGP